jgi:hypothetical protein
MLFLIGFQENCWYTLPPESSPPEDEEINVHTFGCWRTNIRIVQQIRKAQE